MQKAFGAQPGGPVERMRPPAPRKSDGRGQDDHPPTPCKDYSSLYPSLYPSPCAHCLRPNQGGGWWRLPARPRLILGRKQRPLASLFPKSDVVSSPALRAHLWVMTDADDITLQGTFTKHLKVPKKVLCSIPMPSPQRIIITKAWMGSKNTLGRTRIQIQVSYSKISILSSNYIGQVQESVWHGAQGEEQSFL